LKLQGGVIPTTPVDPLNEVVGILISNANGVIYSASLMPGDMHMHGTRIVKFIDKTAKTGNGIRGGLAKVQLFNRTGRFHLKVQAYADFSAATLPTMTVQFQVGNDVFMTKGDWARTTHGWKLEFAPFPH